MPPKRTRAAAAAADEGAASEDASIAPPPAKRGKRAAAEKGEAGEGDKGWKEFNTVLTYTPPEGMVPGAKVIGFDIDDTIIRTKSGKTFATGPSDWEFWHPSVPSKLKEHHDAGHKIVFFSNQGGIGKGQTTAAAFKEKLNKVLQQIPVPVQVYASTMDGKYRKPATGMWGMFLRGGNAGAEVDLAGCTYVGDAAGRAKDWAPGKKKDFSDSDRKFAINLGIRFQTPEEFFLGHSPVKFELHGADPRSLSKEGPLYEPQTAQLIAKGQELVVMVGYPGSGKSFFSVKELEQKGGYVRVNRDTLKTKEKCWKAAEEALDAGKSVVIDNTNPDAASRAPYLAMAKKRNIPARAFVMQTTMDEALHNNHFREIVTNGEQEHVPTMVFRMFRKNFAEPTQKEGFSEVLKTYFRPRFDNKETEKLFYMWTPL